MAHRGTGFFDTRGNYHKTPEDATIADLAGILGKIGDGDSLAPALRTCCWSGAARSGGCSPNTIR